MSVKCMPTSTYMYILQNFKGHYSGMECNASISFFFHFKHYKTSTYTVGIQSRTVLSLEAEATRCPEGENLTSITASYRRSAIKKLNLLHQYFYS